MKKTCSANAGLQVSHLDMTRLSLSPEPVTADAGPQPGTGVKIAGAATWL